MLPLRIERRRVVGALLGGIAVPALAAAPSPDAARAAPLLTALDGVAFLLRGTDRFALLEGVALQRDDILEVPADGRLVRIEFADGLACALGPGSRALLLPRFGGEAAGAVAPNARLYLLSGWVKLGAPPAVLVLLLAPSIQIATTGGTLVLSVRLEATLLFAESGEALLRRGGTAARPPQPLRAGELLSLSTEPDAAIEIASRPSRAFVASVPRAFMDSLPARADRWRAHPVEPRRLGALVYADAQPWIDAEPPLRRAYLPRWRAAARDPDFRRALVAGLPSHPEWKPVLFPPNYGPPPGRRIPP